MKSNISAEIIKRLIRDDKFKAEGYMLDGILPEIINTSREARK